MQASFLEFDEINHQVVFHQQKVNLNPLSFKLLALLAQAQQQTVPIETIMQEVWRNGSVTPDTLKQRVFLLRKSLTDAGMTGLAVQSVRGEGYRLIVEPSDILSSQVSSESDAITTKPKSISQPSKSAIKAIALIIGIITVSALLYSFVKPTQFYSNNRVALWRNIELGEMSKLTSDLYSQWNTELLQQNGEHSLQVVMSERQKDMLVPIQARRNRLALVSYFEVIKNKSGEQVRLTIVEPKTATILISSPLDLSEGVSNSQVNQAIMKKHIAGIKALISSGKLHLSKQQKDNPLHPVWAELKALADQG